MDCRKIEPQLSPYLDGELLPAEAAEVKNHLVRCAHCSREYELLLHISGALQQSARLEIPAPSGFTAALMERINNEAKVVSLPQKRRWLNDHWRQTAAGVAAAIMVAWGSFSLTSGPIVQIAENPPAIEQPDNNVNPTSDPGNSVLNPGAGVDTPAVPNDDPGTNPAVIAQNPNGNFEPLVLLNKERNLSTTLIMIKASDSSKALERAINMAVRDSAQVQNLGQQVNENGNYTVLQITVPKILANDLTQGLAALGRVTYQETSKNDITTQFADKLSQYQALVSQRASLRDSGQMESLDQRIKALGSELKDWDQKAEQETIILWLEK